MNYGIDNLCKKYNILEETARRFKDTIAKCPKSYDKSNNWLRMHHQPMVSKRQRKQRAKEIWDYMYDPEHFDILVDVIGRGLEQAAWESVVHIKSKRELEEQNERFFNYMCQEREHDRNKSIIESTKNNGNTVSFKTIRYADMLFRLENISET